MIATTTKIVTREGLTQSHLRKLPIHPHALLLIEAPRSRRPRWSGIGDTLERHPFSGLIHLAGEFLHTP